MTATTTAPRDRRNAGGLRGRFNAYDRWLVAATVVAVIPIVWAVITALSDGWIASADNAYFLLRAGDVGTEHTPLLGTWTSSSSALDFDLNNPGPMLFFLLAIPVRLGGSVGMLVAIALLNASAVVGVAWALRRNAGPVVAAMGLVGVTGLGWSVGRPMLIDPWQPHSLIHTAFLFCVLAWVCAAGDRWALPFAVFVASLLVQTHVSYVYLAAVLGLLAFVGLMWNAALPAPAESDADGLPGEPWESVPDAGVIATVDVASADTDRDSDVEADDVAAATGRKRSIRRALVALRWPIAVSLLVGFVCWLPPLIEQFTAEGRGNLSRLFDASRSDTPTLGFRSGLRVSADVLAAWPTWARPSFEAPDFADTPISLGVAVVALGVLITTLGLLGWSSYRRRERFAFLGCTLAIAAVVASVFTASGVFRTEFEVALHHYRYLWPVAILTQLAIAVALVRLLRANRAATFAISIVLVTVLAVANLGGVARWSYDDAIAASDAVGSMKEQIAVLEGSGTVVIPSVGRPFPEPFLAAMYAELDRLGVDFVVFGDEPELRQIGTGRGFDGEGDTWLSLAWGPYAIQSLVRGGERIVFVTDLDDDEIEAWIAARDAMRAAVDAGDVTVAPGKREAFEAEDFDLPVTDDGTLDPTDTLFLFDSPDLYEALSEGLVEVRGVDPAVVERWLELYPTVAWTTFAVWIVPEADVR